MANSNAGIYKLGALGIRLFLTNKTRPHLYQIKVYFLQNLSMQLQFFRIFQDVCVFSVIMSVKLLHKS